MMPNFKDRKPAFAGGRSFFPSKEFSNYYKRCFNAFGVV